MSSPFERIWQGVFKPGFTAAIMLRCVAHLYFLYFKQQWKVRDIKSKNH